MVPSGGFGMDDGYKAMKRLFARRSRGLPSAVFCICDEIAYGALKAAREECVRVPDDISITGSDDLPMSEFVMTPLTTVRVDRQAIGRNAVKMLLRRMAEPELPQQRLLLPSKLVVRESTGRPSGSLDKNVFVK